MNEREANEACFPDSWVELVFANPSTDALSFRSGSDERTERFISYFEEAIALVSTYIFHLISFHFVAPRNDVASE